MMHVLRANAATIVLALWAVVWFAGVRSDMSIGAALALATVAVWVTVQELGRTR